MIKRTKTNPSGGYRVPEAELERCRAFIVADAKLGEGSGGFEGEEEEEIGGVKGKKAGALTAMKKAGAGKNVGNGKKKNALDLDDDDDDLNADAHDEDESDAADDDSELESDDEDYEGAMIKKEKKDANGMQHDAANADDDVNMVLIGGGGSSSSSSSSSAAANSKNKKGGKGSANGETAAPVETLRERIMKLKLTDAEVKAFQKKFGYLPEKDVDSHNGKCMTGVACWKKNPCIYDTKKGVQQRPILWGGSGDDEDEVTDSVVTPFGQGLSQGSSSSSSSNSSSSSSSAAAAKKEVKPEKRKVEDKTASKPMKKAKR